MNPSQFQILTNKLKENPCCHATTGKQGGKSSLGYTVGYSPFLPLPPSCARPCGSSEWQLWCLLWNSLWHLPPRGTLNYQPTGVTPTGTAAALHFLPWMTSDTPSLCLVALKRQSWGFLSSQAAGCNWCGRDVSTNLLLSDGQPLIHSILETCRTAT